MPIEGNLIFPLQGETICSAQEFPVSYPMLESCKVYGRYFHPRGPGAIADITESLVRRRREAQALGDKFGDALLKIVINSGYGKTGQGLRHKRSTDLENSTKERVVTSEIPPSKNTTKFGSESGPLICYTAFSNDARIFSAAASSSKRGGNSK